MKMLLEQETYTCGTTRANRKNWPTEFRKPTVLNLKRGESRKMQHEDVTAVVWQDKRVVLLLFTNSNPRTDGSVTRKIGKGNEEIEIACPQAVINYTKHMGGVDGCKWLETRVLWSRPIFKKMVEIYITFCPKCVSCELFHLIWPDKSSPLYSTRKQATDLQTKLGASADWYIHVSQEYRQVEKFAYRNCIP